MVDIVVNKNHRVKQVVPFRMTPSRAERILREMGPEHLRLLQRLELRQLRIEAQARERVEAERAEAVEQGVNVVIDESLPETFDDEVLPDVE
jgi:hypothetical protein